MIYTSSKIEQKAVMNCAELMCAAAHTAPKTCGIDKSQALILDGEDKEALAAKMEELDLKLNNGEKSFISRDANCVRESMAVVLIGIEKHYYGLNCQDCGFESCGACRKANGSCLFTGIDLGIAVSSAVECASDMHIDNRIMYSVGKAAQLMDYTDKNVV